MMNNQIKLSDDDFRVYMSSDLYRTGDMVNMSEQHISFLIPPIIRYLRTLSDVIIDRDFIIDIINNGLDIKDYITNNNTNNKCVIKSFVIYKSLIKLNIITPKLKALFYDRSYWFDIVDHIIYDYPSNIWWDIESGFKYLPIDNIIKANNSVVHSTQLILNHFGISNKKIHLYLMNGRNTICEYRHIKNIIHYPSDYRFAHFDYINSSTNFDFSIWCKIHKKEHEQHIFYVNNDMSLNIHMHNILYEISKKSNDWDSFIPDIIGSYKDMQHFKFHDLVNHETIKPIYDDCLAKHANQSTVIFPDDHRFKSIGQAKLITNGQNLINEGLVMKHCVGGQGYINACITGDTKIVHFDTDDKFGVTAEFRKNSGEFVVHQVKGYRNREPIEQEIRLVNDYISYVNKGIN